MIKSAGRDMDLKLLITLLVVSVSNSAYSQYLSCDPNKVGYELNGTFHNNLDSLLESLSTKAAAPENKGFYKSSYGSGPDKVYGRALCRGDSISVSSAAACKTCLANASMEIISKCAEQSAFIWSERCQIDYSYKELTSGYGGKYSEYSKADKASNPHHFCTALGMLFHKLSETARSSDLMFAAGRISFSGDSETLYGFVQCTRDIDAGSCGSCLGMANADLDGCRSSKGGAVTSRTCNLRFELHPFFEEGENDLWLHTQGHKSKRWRREYVAIAICAAIFVVALAGFYILRKWRNQGEGDEENRESPMLHLRDKVSPKSHVLIKEETDMFTSQDFPLMDFVMAAEELLREDRGGGKARELKLEKLGIVKSKVENEGIGFGPKLLLGASSG